VKRSTEERYERRGGERSIERRERIEKETEREK
jgi:hypothetical protein